MALGIYKPGQGYWTRVMSAVGWGTIVLMGAAWLWNLLSTRRIGDIEPIYVQGAAAVLVMALGGWVLYYLTGLNRRTVDFLIATEGEMKKVNWSTRREIIGSTWVVIALTIFISAMIFVLDYIIFAPLFRAVGVLESA
jgi:preprotein translocase SecE subunit